MVNEKPSHELIQSMLSGNDEIGWVNVTAPGTIIRDKYVKRVSSGGWGNDLANYWADKNIIYYRKNKDGLYRAKKLLDYMGSHEGFVSDSTEREAAIIGMILGYNKESIKKYIENKLKK